ncbi:thiamine pyrophosphate-binding protein [Pedobacter hiemivivus]|uniref:Thiamine pyrophosphate-binding protein n=1 Tax=Pedobacter hiemivivus TaxID=2530454 RepID=A0A4R0NAF6_9SPHI|nr:thiamine pyrophosphate-binding protein [Pedobacter hiemivivus]TCC96243.1 thiamine pyrophosphate-binding protein [Pedobacter hiemivivus]
MGRLVKVSDLIVEFFEEKNVEHIFLLSGGMMMHLLDSVSKSKQIKYICNHHEQACAIAAEGYARIKNVPAVCYATSGPGATNTITGIAGAWLDSSPVIFLTGQSRSTLTVMHSKIDNLRMLGNFEVDIAEITKSITKYSVFIDRSEDVLFHLQKAYYLASTGRPGPVLLDLPLDVQGATVDLDTLPQFQAPENENVEFDFTSLKEDLKNYKQPLIVAGHGVRVAGEVQRFRDFVQQANIPVVTTQLANDLLPYDFPQYIGRLGLRGDRAGNFAVQSADLILTIGTSLHVTTTGYETEDFAPNAKKIVIDLDEAVLAKNKSISQIQIKSDISTLLYNLNDLERLDLDPWIRKLTQWKEKFKIINEPHHREGEDINTYHLMDMLSKILNDNDVLVTDAGSLYYITGQAFLSKANQRVIVSGGLGAMGYALPASIGAALAAPERNVICITGDGSMQLNIQELQTLAHYKLNCKVIIINNGGYASIRNSQASFLDGHLAGSSRDTGVSFPDWEKIAAAYSIDYSRENQYSDLKERLAIILNKQGPQIIEVVIPENVVMIPAVTSVRLDNGSFKSNRLHEMTPYLSEEQLNEASISINI